MNGSTGDVLVARGLLGTAGEEAMAFVPGFKHDVFVSYAHLDNEHSESSPRGWIDTLVAELKRELSQRVGRRDIAIWQDDEQLAGNRPITREIVAAIEQAATLLVVMSPSYLASEWCERERRLFLEHVQRRVSKDTVFVVHARRVQEMPEEFGDLKGYRFFTEDEPKINRPLTVLERDYGRRVLRLSYELKTRLEEELRPASTSIRIDPDRPRVFIARATEDLEDREEELRSYLGQAAIGILPERSYPQTDRTAFETAMRRDLARSAVFVQLLSAARGLELPFAPGRRHPRFQMEIARSAGVPILQWRDRAVDLDAIRDPDHKALVDGARVCGIEEFKRVVVDQVRRVPVAPPPPSTSRMVFVNADKPDRSLARDVARALNDFGVECYWPLSDGTPEAIRTDLEENLRSCDGLLLVYGMTGPDWVRQQLRQGRKIISQRERNLAALAVFEGPPPEKGDLGLALPNLLTLDCRGGLDAGVLKRFVESLNG